MAHLHTPKYLTLQKMKDNVIELIRNNIPEVAQRLQARGLVKAADVLSKRSSEFLDARSGITRQTCSYVSFFFFSFSRIRRGQGKEKTTAR